MVLFHLLSLLKAPFCGRRTRRVLGRYAFCFPFMVMLGCGDQGLRTTLKSASQVLSGNVQGGQQPISGATIQLYATGATGDGSSSTPLFSAPVRTNSNGQFNFGPYSCPSPTTNVYLTATGGNPGLQSGTTNSAIALMVALGPCGSITASTWVSVNERSTVAAVYSLAPFMQAYNSIGSAQVDSQLMSDSFEAAGEMVNPGTGAVPGLGLPTGQTVPAQKLSALANILATCINSSGGRAGDGSVCGSFFSLTTPPSGVPPEDTVQALLNLANYPSTQVVPLYLLSPPLAPFQPTLTSPPSDWTLSLSSATPVPTLSPAPGIYTSSPSIILSDSNPNAQIYYTNDGTTPTTSSQRYTGALLLPTSGIIRAIAVAGGSSSVPVAGSYTIQQPTIVATRLAFVTQPSTTTVGSPISPSIAVAIEDGSGNVLTNATSVVTLALAGSTSSAATGTLTATTVNGIASFNNVIVTLPGTGYQLAASSYGLASALSAAFTASAVTVVPSTLRQAGAQHGILMGSSAEADEFGQPNPLVVDPQYAATLSTQYSLLEAENAMKWLVIGWQQGSYNFEPGDTLLAFAQANQMQMRGHTLCWNNNNPSWLYGLSSSALSQTLQTYISTVMGHYRGSVFAWDVVNEAISDSTGTTGTTLKDSLWYDAPGIGLSGTGYIEQAFRWARAADPSALLFYNDYGIETTGNKSQALLNMLTDFKSRGVPIDGVGVQMHVDTSMYYPSTFPEALKAYTDLGLQVHITEMDIRVPVDANGNASNADLQAQAQTYQFIVSTCIKNPLCTAIQTWGFTDKYSWIPSVFAGLGAALPFDTNYGAKPAYGAMMNALR